jgi:hypothetical protein
VRRRGEETKCIAAKQKGESPVNETPKRIDVHHHIVPKEYVDRLSKKGIDLAPIW